MNTIKIGTLVAVAALWTASVCSGDGPMQPDGQQDQWEPVWWIEPSSPTEKDVISFFGITRAVSNDCYWARHTNGVAAFLVDRQGKTVELRLGPGQAGLICADIWEPVYKEVAGQFGPLPASDWELYSEDMYITFSMPLHVSAAAEVIYVDDDADGLNDGSSWKDAYRHLQDALAAAGNGDQIRVAQGIYRPDRGIRCTPGDREATFQLINGVALKGGYAGLGEPDPNARDVELYKVILNGDLADNDTPMHNQDPSELYKDPTRADNSFRIVTVTAVDPNTSLDGFVIQGAYAHYFEVAECDSAGLYIGENGNITVRDCVFTMNATSGVFCERSSPAVINSTFENNTRRGNGGGLLISEGSPQITGCILNGNLAWSGGGIYSSEALLRVEDCAFVENRAFCSGCRCPSGMGGALHCCDSLPGSTVKGCKFVENAAIFGGGASLGTCSAYLPADTPGRGEEILVSDCSFVRNQAPNGGAIWQLSYTVQIENSVFCENSASGGIIRNDCGSTGLTNCILVGNYADSLGAAVFAHGIIFPDYPPDYFFAVTLRNCTLVGNTAPVGRTIACRSEDSSELDSVRISNCIVSNDGNEIHNPNGSHVTIAYTDLRGGITSMDDPCNAVIWAEGNIDVDPCFADPGYWDPNGTPDEPNDDFWVDGDYHLKSQAGRWDANSESWTQDDVTSLSVDAGDPISPIGHEPFPNGGIVNMGAYGGTAEASKSYFGEPVCETIIAGDINGDCKVDFSDFRLMALHWLHDNNP